MGLRLIPPLIQKQLSGCNSAPAEENPLPHPSAKLTVPPPPLSNTPRVICARTSPVNQLTFALGPALFHSTRSSAKRRAPRRFVICPSKSWLNRQKRRRAEPEKKALLPWTRPDFLTPARRGSRSRDCEKRSFAPFFSKSTLYSSSLVLSG